MWRILLKICWSSPDQHGRGVDWESTWEGSTKTLEGLPLTVFILGVGVNWQSTWEGSTKTLEGLPLTVFIGGGVNWQSTWKGSTKTLPGLTLRLLISGGGGNWQSIWEGSVKTLGGLPLIVLILGGQLTINLGRIHKDFGRSTSNSVDPGGGSIDSQHGKDPWRLWKDYLWQCWSLGNQLTINLGRIHEDFGRITSDSVDPEGSINSQLGKDLQTLWKDHLWQCWSWGVNWQSTWEGSAKTLEGLPLTVLILGVGGQSTVNMGRICKDFGRITSDSVDPGGFDQQSTLEGSTNTLEGLPPPPNLSEVILPRSSQILPRLTVNWCPSPPLPPHIHMSISLNWLSTNPPHSMFIWGWSTDFDQILHYFIERVHLDDLDVLDMLKMLWSSVVRLAKKFNSTSFNLKQEVFIRRDEDWPEEGWYLYRT